jgi:hypothetical protein
MDLLHMGALPLHSACEAYYTFPLQKRLQGTAAGKYEVRIVLLWTSIELGPCASYLIHVLNLIDNEIIRNNQLLGSGSACIIFFFIRIQTSIEEEIKIASKGDEIRPQRCLDILKLKSY